MRFAAHVAPHLVELGAEPTTHLEFIRTPYLHLHVLGGQVLQHRLIHLVELRFFFFNSFRTVVGLTCNTRAVSRMPLAFMAISTICSSPQAIDRRRYIPAERSAHAPQGTHG